MTETQTREPEILENLSEPERRAVRLVKTTVDCFNSRHGIGLFSGPARYNVLEERMMLCAVQARSLTEFWGILLRKMRWSTPPKRMDAEIVPQLDLTEREGLSVLRAIATQTASIVMLARYWHDETKQERRELEAEWKAIEEGAGAARAEEQEALDVS